MKNRGAVCAAVAGASLLLVVLAYGGPKEFWVVKPYTEWTAAEVGKILEKKSPWTHVLLLVPTDPGGGRGSTRSPNPTYSTPVYINWNSRIVRQAIVRKTILESPETPKEEIDKVLNYQPPTLEIFVNGPVLGGGRGAGQAEAIATFKQKTFLQKKNKEKIPLADLVMPSGKRGSLTLLFAREVGGKPTVTLEDTEITLMIRIGENDHKFVFKLADMTVDGKLEI
jgi:hypothetical protein